MDACPEELVDLAGRLADKAGAVIRGYFRTRVAVDQKGDLSPVTIADREAELAIRAMLAAERPDHGVIGEEYGAERPDAGHVWVIDPIDGTKSFITGRPIFGTLIACLKDGVPILGVIDQPVIADRWVGAKGRPTLFNGAPARIRDCPVLDRAALGTTALEAFSAEGAAAFQRLRQACQVAVYGGDCYSYGLLAAGFLDLVVEDSLKLHDFAALVPVVEGAGGQMTDWQGRPLDQRSAGAVVAAGDPRLLDQALAVLQLGA